VILECLDKFKLKLCILGSTGGVNLICDEFYALDSLLQILLVDQEEPDLYHRTVFELPYLFLTVIPMKKVLIAFYK